MTEIIDTFDDYQNAALETAIYPDESQVLYPAIGMVDEAGEVLSHVKKSIRGDFEIHERREEILAEIGDVLWYMANLCSDLDADLAEVAQYNLDKLRSRQIRGVIQGDGDNR